MTDAPAFDMSEWSEQLKERTIRFSVDVLRLIERLPRSHSWEVVARQLGSSATSIGANFNSACTARSRAEFKAKLQIASEEADETVYWLEIMRRRGVRSQSEVETLHKESIELRAILGRSLGTARQNDLERHLASRSVHVSMPKLTR